MTLYAGEEVRICHTATRDKVALTPDDGVTVHLTILTKDWSEVVMAEAPMTWVEAKGRWELLWDTTDTDPGVYRLKARIEGADGHSNWEYGRTTLKKDPLAA